jgi:F420-non-reducing hydrogenase iron-sulfur subunit
MASNAVAIKAAGEKNSAQFEPRIVAFCCNFCAYAAADLAGSMRLSYPPNARVIRLPCSGKVEILYLLKAIEDGADGVMVIGCLEGDCHFMNGNFRSKKRVAAAKRLLGKTGVEPARLEMFNLSSAMAPKFAEVIKEMTENVRKLGPSPLRKEVAK